ncbi:MAG: type II toxin-antitoxin system VapB family antitoxin [Spirochaetaceae bacterium]|nr:type II toxin-antitoxin system VapB family antitoxin [Spirochaetaceae bacterium]
MRTNIVLDEKLVEEAFKYSADVKTKKELVEIALKEYVARHKMKDLRNIRGKIIFDEGYDYKSMRKA